MTSLRQVALALVFLIGAAVSAVAAKPLTAGTPKAPDFAFPKKVSADAQRRLSAALREGDDVKALRALIDLTVAEGSIDEENIQSCYNKIESAAASMKSEAARAMTRLLQASIMYEYYDDNIHTFMERQAPIEPRPQKWDEWTDGQFKKEIVRLLDEALASETALRATPIEQYDAILNSDPIDASYFPSLFDVACYQAISILEKMDSDLDDLKILPPAMIGRVAEAATRPLTTRKSESVDRILSIYTRLIRVNSDESRLAPYVNATIEALNFVSDLVVNYDDEDIDPDELMQKELLRLFEKYETQSEYAGDYLIAYLSTIKDSEKMDFFARTKAFVDRWPAYRRAGCLKKSINSMLSPSVSTSFQYRVEPGMAFTVDVDITNSHDAYIKIYRLKPVSDSKNDDWMVESTEPVAQKYFQVTEEMPFKVKRTAQFILDRPGYYYVMASHSNNERPKKTIQRYSVNLVCTTVALNSIEGDKSWIYSFNPATGAPIADVDLYYLDSKRERVNLGTTNQSGIFVYENNGKKFTKTIFPIKAEDQYGISTDMSQLIEQNGKNLETVSFTDLPLYHPGDSVGWETIVYQRSYVKEQNKTVVGLALKAYLKNVNRQTVDSADVVTDEFGRVSGRFHIPTGELTGQYQISLEISGPSTQQYPRTRLNGAGVMVSDYKLPTFRIETEKPLINTPAKGDVTIKGRVVTYSGFGLANATVKISLDGRSRGRYYNSRTQNIYTDSLTTGDGGEFTFKIASELLDESANPKSYFTGSLSATSPAGETQTGKVEFAREKFYTLFAELTGTPYTFNYNDKVYDNSKPIEVNVIVRDAERKEANLDVRMTICDNNDDEKLMSMVLPSGKSTVNLSSLAPGRYCFHFELADTTLKELCSGYEDSYTLFSPKATASPATEPIWVCMLKQNKQLKKGEKAKFYYAVPTNNSYFILTLSSGGKIYSSHWIKADAGVHEMEVTMPVDVDKAHVSFVAYRNFSSSTSSFDIALAEEKLELKCESFRDKLIPGQTETWTFRTVNSDGSPIKSALAMRMFTDQLNALRKSSFVTSFSRPYSQNIWIHSRINNVRNYCSAVFPKNFNDIYPATGLKCPAVSCPDFNDYGKGLIGQFNGYYKSMPNKMLKSTTMLDRVPPKAQSSTVDMVIVRGTGNAVEKEEAADDAVMSETGRMEKTYTYAVAVGPEETPAAAEVAEYRENTSPLAFFKPTLTTDDDGQLVFSFTVPNANTTWALDAFAFTPDLLSSSLSRTMTASKPVMVSPNLPRFLRTGDKANIVSLVMNNTDKEQTVVTTTELFNPISNEVVNSTTTTSTIPANQNVSLNMVIDVPADATTALGFRIKSATSDFSDGEQALVAVLPSSQPVIETVPFYISPDSTQFEMTLPRIGDNARVTLQYCDNPTWYVATALPGLRKGKMTTVDEAADAIFSAATARGILKQNPAIADAIRQWTDSDKSDSTLISMLQRNADLKTMLLNATPWMVEAMTDTERMQRLALLFDPKEIETTCSEAIALLQRLQRPSGGWAWMSKIDAASTWATRRCLMTLGRLNQLGYLPNDKSLNKMIREALAWDESQTVKEYKKYPKYSYLEFALTLDMWPDYRRSLTSDKIVKAEVQRVVKEWKKYSVDKKATCAVLISHNGYDRLAQTILSSVYEFAKQSPVQGMWWPSITKTYGGSMYELATSASILRAIAAISPQSKNIDPIRQWLILQKEARNWGSGATATDVVQAVLSTSPSLIERAGSVKISIGDTQLPVSYSDASLGYFRSNISSMNPSEQTLTISKTTNTPSWGAVYTQSTMTMSDIKPSSCEAVSIEKRVFVNRDNQWREATDLQVGDRVKIQLLVHAVRAMQYVVIDDNRAACFEPVEQLPVPLYSQGLCFYRENRDSATNLFVTNMPKGTYMIEYEMFVNNSGEFSSGIATIQSQYAPQLTAHSAGNIIRVSVK